MRPFALIVNAGIVMWVFVVVSENPGEWRGAALVVAACLVNSLAILSIDPATTTGYLAALLRRKALVEERLALEEQKRIRELSARE